MCQDSRPVEVPFGRPHRLSLTFVGLKAKVRLSLASIAGSIIVYNEEVLLPESPSVALYDNLRLHGADDDESSSRITSKLDS